MQKQNEARARALEHVAAVATDDNRQRHFERALQQIGEGRDPAVQDDIAGLRQGFVFQVDDVLQWKFVADDRPDQFEAVTLRKEAVFSCIRYRKKSSNRVQQLVRGRGEADEPRGDNGNDNPDDEVSYCLRSWWAYHRLGPNVR